MRRRLFNFAAAVSLVLCLTTLGLWIQSFRAANQYSRYDGTWMRSFGSTEGRLYFMAAPAGRPGTLGWRRYPPYDLRLRQPLPGEPGVRHHGTVPGVFWYITDGGTPNGGMMPVPNSGGQMFFSYFAPNRIVFISHWLAAAAFALLPASWLVSRFRRLRAGGGSHCGICDYDLTGNTSGVCPECGTPVANEPPTPPPPLRFR